MTATSHTFVHPIATRVPIRSATRPSETKRRPWWTGIVAFFREASAPVGHDVLSRSHTGRNPRSMVNHGDQARFHSLL